MFFYNLSGGGVHPTLGTGIFTSGNGTNFPVSFNACEMGTIAFGVKTWEFQYSIKTKYGLLHGTKQITGFATDLADLIKNPVPLVGIDFISGDIRYPDDSKASGIGTNIHLSFGHEVRFPFVNGNPERFATDIILASEVEFISTNSSWFNIISGILQAASPPQHTPPDIFGKLRFCDKEINIFRGPGYNESFLGKTSVDFKVFPVEYWPAFVD